MDYLQLAKNHLGAGVHDQIDAQMVIACALVDIAESLRAQGGGTGGSAEDQPH